MSAAAGSSAVMAVSGGSFAACFAVLASVVGFPAACFAVLAASVGPSAACSVVLAAAAAGSSVVLAVAVHTSFSREKSMVVKYKSGTKQNRLLYLIQNTIHTSSQI